MSKGPRLGILGAGQLAQMLAQAAHRLGVPVSVLAQRESDPACLPGVEVLLGALDDARALDSILSRVTHLTTENEFLNLQIVGDALGAHPAVSMRPGLEGIAAAQDKLAQKRLFQELCIPSAPHITLAASDLTGSLEAARHAFPDGFVLKWSRFGYDGKGNFVCRPDDEGDLADCLVFCSEGLDRGGQIYAEKLIPFTHEVAMVSTRGERGEHVFFPLVISVQERGVCREVVGPATALGVSTSLEEAAQAAHRQVGQRLQMVGSFAIEFFVTEEGALLANEMAPRVHNTGHYSLWEDDDNQFQTHVRAVMGLPLAPPTIRGLFVMRNLLGPWDIPGSKEVGGFDAPCPPRAALTWYGKRTASAGRKMGHVTGRAADEAALQSLRKELADYEQVGWDAVL